MSDDGDQSAVTMEERLELYREKKRQEREAKALKSRRQRRRPRWSSTSSATSTSGGGGAAAGGRGSLSSCRCSGDGSIYSYSRQSVGSIGSSRGGGRSSAGSALGLSSSLDRTDRLSPASASFAGTSTGTRAHAVSVGSRVPPRPVQNSGMVTPSSRRAKRGGGKAGPSKVRSSGSCTGRTPSRGPLSVIQCARTPDIDAKNRGSSGSAAVTKTSSNSRDPTTSIHPAKSEVVVHGRNKRVADGDGQYTLPLAGQLSVSPLSSPEEDEGAVDDESEFPVDGSVQIPVISAGSRGRTDGENHIHHDSKVTSAPVSQLRTSTSSSCGENNPRLNIASSGDEESDDYQHSSGLFFCDEADVGNSENRTRTKKETSRKKNRRKTTLFRPQPDLEQDEEDAAAPEVLVAVSSRPRPDSEQDEEDSAASEVPASSKAPNETMVEVEEEKQTRAKPGEAEDIDQALQAPDCERLAGLCKVYRDEHSALRFLVGILKLEKSDAEERMKTLSEAYEGKLVQNRSISAELTTLRKENATLRKNAAEKEEAMEKMISTLQTQMTTGLSAAIQKTKALQMQLDAANLERERLERQLAETRNE